ncbi:MAG: phosphopentomutase [Bacilli bacterium]|nr:phosphopentomutase [Bacilli bacterium]
MINMFKRIFLIVLDSLGVGEANDASKYGDSGANTLGHIIENKNYNLDVLENLGLISLVKNIDEKTYSYYMKAKPNSLGKDTLNGHYEMMGILSNAPFKTFPEGFPLELITEIKNITNRDVIGNVAASGTEIIERLGEMHMKTGAIIVYTSADSVLQIAAHEEVVPLDELYDICKKVRKLTEKEEYKVGRIIARPFIGNPGSFTRTSNRKDFTLEPEINMLDLLQKNKIDVYAIGKIGDIFNNRGLKVSIKTTSNLDGLMKLVDFSKSDFTGLCFANLNDFDTLYGHRRDKDNYLKALEEFNHYLPIFLKNIGKEDLVIITADHGNDPTFKGTDHTRENVPVILYSPKFKDSRRLNDRETFSDVGATILDNFNIENPFSGRSILKDINL